MSNDNKQSEQPIDPKEALTHIRTLARVAFQSDDDAMVQEHLKMILTIVDRALPDKRKRRGQ